MHKTRRILVVANETVASPILHGALRSCAADEPCAQVLVVAPALNSRVRHWLSDIDPPGKPVLHVVADAYAAAA